MANDLFVEQVSYLPVPGRSIIFNFKQTGGLIMEKKKQKISLGFTNQQFEPGVHICQIFNDDEERHGALVNFLISGLQAGENTSCFTEKETETTLADHFAKHGISYQEVEHSGALTLSKTADVYFEGGKFDPERMLTLIQEFYENSMGANKAGARVIGEMLPEVEKMPGGSRLMEYESKISILLRKYPVTAVCQYDAREFDGATILDILKVHPFMIVHGSVVHNPFFIHPEEYLAKNCC